MRPLDPAAGPVERLASELRALRALAGSQPFWKMARRCSVSKSALAAAAAGRKLPSEQVTREFVRVCGGDWDWWRERWARAVAELQAVDAADARAGGLLVVRPQYMLNVLRGQLLLPPDTDPDGRTPSARPAVGARPRRYSGRFLAVAILVVAGAITWANYGFGSSERPSSPVVKGQVPDGTDPAQVGCYADEETLATASVLLQKPARLRGRVLAIGTNVGTVSLLYSPRCAGAWARFHPTPGLNPDPDDTTVGAVTVEADRPADNTDSLWHMGHIDSSYSGILLTGIGCVIAHARVDMIGQNVSATGQTPCLPHLA